MEILIILGVFIVAFISGGVYGWNARERHAIRVLEQFRNEVSQERKELIPIVVEKHNDLLFVYNQENKEFMAQGSSLDEINDALEKRYPGKKFSCSDEHLKMLKAM